jgi:V8-like Glu-specific endopeptidase
MNGQFGFEADPFDVGQGAKPCANTGQWIRHDDRVVVLLDEDDPRLRNEELYEGATARPGNPQTAMPPATKSRVSDTFAVPFRWIAKISILENGKERPVSSGTGVLISDLHVLTAAHVVSDVVQNPARFSLSVTIALDGNKDLGTFVPPKKPDIPRNYKPDVLDYDYALITLSQPIADLTPRGLGGGKLCFWGSSACGAGTTGEPVDASSLSRITAYTAGYPRNKGANQMWGFSGGLISASEQSPIMVYQGELTEGQSGSPVWIQHDGTYDIVGIAVARGSSNRVVRLSWDVVFQLNSWMLAAQNRP